MFGEKDDGNGHEEDDDKVGKAQVVETSDEEEKFYGVEVNPVKDKQELLFYVHIDNII